MKHDRNIRMLITIGLMLFLSGCGAGGLLGFLTKAMAGGDMLESAIAVADAGQEAFFDRHPSPEREPQVKGVLRKAVFALDAYKASLAAAEAVDDGDVAKTKEEALKAYGAAKKLLDEFGIPTATAPPGGAETDAPMPEPFELPEADTIRQRM